MDVYATGTSASGGNIFFDASYNSVTGRVYHLGGTSGGVIETEGGFGLVTGFSTSAVPIPGAILLFAPGLAGLAAIRRRFKK
jgi:hypothetical protein